MVCDKGWGTALIDFVSIFMLELGNALLIPILGLAMQLVGIMEGT